MSLDERSKYLRRLVVRTLAGGARGHVGSTLSLIEIMRVLYDDILRYRPDEPDWPERDRMILSKGHGCIALYVMLAVARPTESRLRPPTRIPLPADDCAEPHAVRGELDDRACARRR